MTHPVAAVVTRLEELYTLVDVATDRDYDAAACGLTLRDSFLAATKKLGHEFVRFTLVLRATGGEAKALADTLPGVADAAATVVAGLQLITKAGGATFQADYRRYGRALTQAILDSVLPVATGTPLSDAVVAAQAQRMLHRAGVVLQLVEQAERLPLSNAAAVRRRLLLVGRLAKSSADDVAREQEEGDDDGGGCGEDEEAGEAAGGDDDDDREEDAAAVDPEALRHGSDALRTTAAAVRVALEASDAVAQAKAGAATAAAGAPAPPSTRDWPDALAEVCDALKDAIVDFASALSDGAGAAAVPAAALWTATGHLGALCDARAPPALAEQLRDLRVALAEQLARAAPAVHPTPPSSGAAAS